MPSETALNGRRSWSEAARTFLHRRVIALLFLGFSAGVPILLIFSTLSLWLREAEVARATITYFSWAALGYGFKFVWAPVIDKMPLPILTALMGHRRSWLLISQFAIIAAIALMGSTDPAVNLSGMAAFAIMLGLSSATQDIIIDAYRIESASQELQATMAAAYIAGYRIGMLVAGAGALELAGILDVVEGYDYAAWSMTYWAMAAVMLIGVATTLVISEPQVPTRDAPYLRSLSDYLRFVLTFVLMVSALIFVFGELSGWVSSTKALMVAEFGMIKELAGFLVETLRLLAALAAAAFTGWLLITLRLVPRAVIVETYVRPFADFFDRFGRVAFLILALVATYRIADVVMGVIANVFYADIGFEKQEIGRISKAFGLIMTIIGGFAGGLLTMRYGIMRVLFLGGLLAAATNVLFVLLAVTGRDIYLLMAVISADNLSAGIAAAAFVAYLSSLVNTAYTATQFAILTSLMVLLPKIIGGYSGAVVDAIGYVNFFIGTALLGVPVLILILLTARFTPKG
jgi:PAT family beta-lactamase induction signal transducer AmpG